MEKYKGYKNENVKIIGNFYLAYKHTYQYVIGIFCGFRRTNYGVNLGVVLCIANIEINFGYMFLKKGNKGESEEK